MGRWEDTGLTFKASDQTERDGVNKEVSNKHPVFTLLSALNGEDVGEGGGDNGVGG